MSFTRRKKYLIIALLLFFVLSQLKFSLFNNLLALPANKRLRHLFSK